MRRKISCFIMLILCCLGISCGHEKTTQTEDKIIAGMEEALPLDILVIEEYMAEWKEVTMSGEYGESVKLCEVSWELIKLSEEGEKEFPLLAETLEKRNREANKENKEIMSYLLPSAEEIYIDRNEYFTELSSISDYYVQRADDRIVSIKEECSEYSGGVHGMYGIVGVNYDTKTGSDVFLSQIIKEIDRLPELIAPIIRDKYADEYDTYETLEEILKEYSQEDYNWTIGYQGITFYFNPYEIAPYSAGLLTATLWFDEYPGLFEEEYLLMPANGYMMKLPQDEVIEIDLDNTKEGRDRLMISSIYGTPEDHEYGTLHLELTKNGEKYKEDRQKYAFEFEHYLLCLRERDKEKYYLYVQGKAENDYSTIYIYDLNGKEIILAEELNGVSLATKWIREKEDGSHYGYIFSDNNTIEMDTRLDILGTWWGQKSYNITFETGIPEACTEEYMIRHLSEPLISKASIPVTIFQGEGQEGVEELPSGTEFVLLRTDGKTYVDFRLKDGREGRLDLEREDYVYTINGIEEWECFEFLPYAG